MIEKTLKPSKILWYQKCDRLTYRRTDATQILGSSGDNDRDSQRFNNNNEKLLITCHILISYHSQARYKEINNVSHEDRKARVLTRGAKQKTPVFDDLHLLSRSNKPLLCIQLHCDIIRNFTRIQDGVEQMMFTCSRISSSQLLLLTLSLHANLRFVVNNCHYYRIQPITQFAAANFLFF